MGDRRCFVSLTLKGYIWIVGYLTYLGVNGVDGCFDSLPWCSHTNSQRPTKESTCSVIVEAKNTLVPRHATLRNGD